MSDPRKFYSDNSHNGRSPSIITTQKEHQDYEDPVEALVDYGKPSFGGFARLQMSTENMYPHDQIEND